MQFGEYLREERRRRHLSQEAMAEALGCDAKTIRRWEQNQSLPQAHLHLQLSRFFGVGYEEWFGENRGEESATSQWNIPYPRNHFFTGRKEILQQLHEQLSQGRAMALSQAISGLGGIGKTQIALEYAYGYREEYHYIFWTNAATRETLVTDVLAIAELLHLPEWDMRDQKGEQDQKKILGAVKQWFATHTGWLWILDNADDISLVYDFIPTGSPGQLLLTTRAQALGTLAQRLNVEIMGIAEGTLFLLRRAKLLPFDASLDQVEEVHLAAAETIVIEMDALPLALDQAGAYIEEVGCDLPGYLDMYRAHRKELLQRRGRLSTDHPESVSTTWSLSFQKIEQNNAIAADFLRLCAFLEPDTIPEELITEGSRYFDQSRPQAKTVDAFELNAAIEELRRFSLIQRLNENKMLRLHRLVQVVIKDAMSLEIQQNWMRRAVRATNALFPDPVEIANWPLCQRYLPQAQACSELIQGDTLNFQEAASLLFHTAFYLHRIVFYEQAEPLYQRALKIYEQTLGKYHRDVGRILHNMASLNREIDQYEQAEAFYQQALKIYEQTLEPEDPDIARLLDSMARLCYLDHKYEQATLLYQRALKIYEQAFGPEDAHAADPLSGLGRLFNRQGKYEQAEPLFQRALSINKRALGPDHPEVATILNNLATLYNEQGKYELVEPLYRQALSIREKALGSDDPTVAGSLNNLAYFFEDREQYEQAEPLYRKALSIWEQRLGSSHSNIAFGLSNLATLLLKQKKYEEAELSYQKALQLYKQLPYSDEDSIALVLNGLANLYQAQGRYDQAEALFQEALHLREQVSGLHHPDTAETLHDFGSLYMVKGEIRKAEHLYQRALTIRQQIYGLEHPKTIATQTQYMHSLHKTSQNAPSIYDSDGKFCRDK